MQKTKTYKLSKSSARKIYQSFQRLVKTKECRFGNLTICHAFDAADGAPSMSRRYGVTALR